MALYETDIQRWTMVKALEKTNTKGSGFSAFCKKVPECESQTSSGEVADLSDYAGKTIHEGESFPLRAVNSHGFQCTFFHHGCTSS